MSKMVFSSEGKKVEVEEEIITHIRQAHPIDARAILGLMRHVGRETGYLNYGPEGSDLSVVQQKALIENYKALDNCVLLVIEVDDQIIGMANLAGLDQNKQKHVAEIGISIIKEYWGVGIGSFLLEALLDYAEEAGLRVLTLEVVVENERAIHLYERFGFEKKGRLSQRLKDGYRYLDTYIMEKVLVKKKKNEA